MEIIGCFYPIVYFLFAWSVPFFLHVVGLGCKELWNN